MVTFPTRSTLTSRVFPAEVWPVCWGAGVRLAAILQNLLPCLSGVFTEVFTRDCEQDSRNHKCLQEWHLRIARKCKRRGRDSNPRWSYPHTAFPVLHLRPLGHLSRSDFPII